MTPAPLIVALYGGPGTGKSTTAALVFGELKKRGLNVELVHEVAKDMTWEERSIALSHQPYVISKQMFKYDRLAGKVDAIITDTSTLLANIYLTPRDPLIDKMFLDWVNSDWTSRWTLNVVLERSLHRPYNPAGRNQTEHEAIVLDEQIENLLYRMNVPTMSVVVDKSDNSHVDEIVNEVELCLRH